MTQKESRLNPIQQEQSVIGALLIDNSAIDKISDLRPNHFWNADHRKIFGVILKLIAENKPADVITVHERLQANGSDAGDLPYLNQIAQNTPSAANIAHYAAIVRDKFIKRTLIALCRETEESAENSANDSGVMVDKLSSCLEGLARGAIKRESMLVADTLSSHVESIDARFYGSAPSAISTGFVDLDTKLNGGLRRGNLIVVAGRPKMGKTGFALNIANNIAIDGIAAVLSMEMMQAELLDRNIASIGKIHLDHLIDPKKMTEDDWGRLTYAIFRLNDMRLYIDDQPALTLMDVRTKAKAIKRKAYGLDVLVIDYLQLMAGDGDNRNAQIEGITRGLKALAKELDIAIILLSQLNRKLEERTNKRPVASDLRDSGSIEQDCDIAMFLYRDEVYNPDSSDKGICEVNIALNRQGAPAIVPLTYIGENVRFADLGRDWHPAPPKKAPIRSRGMDD